MILLFLGLASFAAVLAFFVRCLQTAPFGEEDEMGFRVIPAPALVAVQPAMVESPSSVEHLLTAQAA